MQIQLEEIGKRFGNEWIFRNVHYTFTTPGTYALLGSNGSGKSTLLQVIAGALMSSKGRITYTTDGNAVADDEIFRHLAFCSPAMELPDDFTLEEQLQFHFGFKAVKNGLSIHALIDLLDLQAHRNKPLKSFSSGMRQRVKLACALFADTPVLLLDEPCTNLDDKGINWYRSMVSDYCAQQLVIVASNTAAEYDFCTHHINVHRFKAAE
jgi:ABC-type multidrug transport system ATPase subunit